MKLLFSDDEQTFAIFFSKQEFQMAYKVLQHITAADDESLENILKIQDKLYDFQNHRPQLKLVKKDDGSWQP
jgi:hypothetical protein